MEISSLPASTSPTAPLSDKAATNIASDFDTFLRLLTAQISNQDPLDPMKAEQFAVQLATFSNVEQSVRTNELLESLVANGNGSDFMALSGWIGRDVRAAAPAQFSGAPIPLDPEPPKAGTRHDLVVRNAAGLEIDRRQIGDTGAPLDWAGTTSAGNRAPEGLYSFAVESFDGSTLAASAPVATYARVTELRNGPGGPSLVLAGGVEVNASDISAVREGA